MSKRVSAEYFKRINTVIDSNQATARSNADQDGLKNQLKKWKYVSTGGAVFNEGRFKTETLSLLCDSGIVVRKGTRVVSRGAAFVEALDPYLNSSEIVQNIVEHMALFDSLSIEECEELKYISIDYLKQSLLLCVNAFFASQKKNIEKKLIESQEMVFLQESLYASIKMFYTFLVFDKFDQSKIAALRSQVRHFLENATLLCDLNRDFFYLAESAQPLRMLITAQSIFNEMSARYNLDENPIDAIVGLPCGGTEAAIITQQVFAHHKHSVELRFAPAASFHQMAGSDDKYDMIDNQLNIKRGERVIVIDDNTATGKTLRSVRSVLEGREAEVLGSYVVEADTDRIIARSKMEGYVTIPDLSMMRHASGKLSVTSKEPENFAHPGRSKLEENAREVLADFYSTQAIKAVKDGSQASEGYWLAREHLVRFKGSRMWRQALIEPNRHIIKFQKTWLSNFWPVKVALDGQDFPSTEHAYQYAKFPSLHNVRVGDLLDDMEISTELRREIDSCKNLLFSQFMSSGEVRPALIKQFSSNLPHTPELNSKEKIEVMWELLNKKFENDELRKKLLDTKNGNLIEGNHWGDIFWGVDQETGVGLNILGRLLMQIRDRLRLESEKYE